MATRIQLRRGTANDWTLGNPLLYAGEAGMEIDTGKIKLGNGSDRWADLEYVDDEDVFRDGPVTTVNGKSGDVILTREDLGLSNLNDDTYIPLSQKAAPNGVASLTSGATVPLEQIPEISKTKLASGVQTSLNRADTSIVSTDGIKFTGPTLSGSGSQTTGAGIGIGLSGTIPVVNWSSGSSNFAIDNAVTSLKRNINGAVDSTQTIPALRVVLANTRDIVHFRQNGSMAMRGRVNFGNEWDRDIPRVGALFNYTIWGPDLPAQVPGQSGGNKVGMTLVVTFAGGYASEASKNVIDPGFLFGANDFIITGKNAGDIEGGTDLWGRLSEVHLYTPGATLTRMYGLIGEAAIEETATGSTIGVISGLHARGARIRANVNIDAHYSLFVTGSERIGAPGEAATVSKDRSIYVNAGLSEFSGGVLMNGKVDGTAQGISGGVRAGYDGAQFGMFISSGGTGNGSTFGIVNKLGSLIVTMPNVGDVLTLSPTKVATFEGAITAKGLITGAGTGGILSTGTFSISSTATAGVRTGYTGGDFGIGFSTGVSTAHMGYTGNTLQIAAHNAGVDRQLVSFDTSAFKTTFGTAVQIGRSGQTDVLTLNQASSTTATAGTASALPAAPAEYITVTTPNGIRKIPLYAA